MGLLIRDREGEKSEYHSNFNISAGKNEGLKEVLGWDGRRAVSEGGLGGVDLLQKNKIPCAERKAQWPCSRVRAQRENSYQRNN